MQVSKKDHKNWKELVFHYENIAYQKDAPT